MAPDALGSVNIFRPRKRTPSGKLAQRRQQVRHFPFLDKFALHLRCGYFLWRLN